MHRPLVRRLPHALHAQSRHRLLHARPFSFSPSNPVSADIANAFLDELKLHLLHHPLPSFSLQHPQIDQTQFIGNLVKDQNWTAPTTDERIAKLELAIAEANQTAAEANQTAAESKTENKLLRTEFEDLAAVTLHARTALSSYLLLYTFIGLHTYRTGAMEKTDHSNPADDAPLPPHLTLLAFHAHYLATNKKVHPPPRLNKVFNDANPANTYFYGPVEEREASFKLGFEMAKDQSTTIISARHGVSHSMKADHIAYCVVRNQSESEAMDRFNFSYIFNQTPEQYLLDVDRVRGLTLFNPHMTTEELRVMQMMLNELG